MTRPVGGEERGAEPGFPLATRTSAFSRSLLRELLGVVSRPGILSMAGGLPDPWLFPKAAYGAALTAVLEKDERALQYSMPFQPLKEQIVRLMALRGVSCTTDDVFITNGAQQGLSLLATLLVDPSAPVLSEEAVYTGFAQALSPLGADHLTVPTDLEGGMDVDAVAWRLERGPRPAFIYVIPDGHNPVGVSMTPAARERLVELARGHRVPIVEDDPYGLLWYGAPHAAPLRALDDEWVLHLGSFSKIIAPGLRLGWMVVPRHLLAPLGILREATDLESSALTCRAVAAWLEAGHLPAHLERLRHEYRERRDRMLAALARHLRGVAQWTSPRGGFFTWVQLPEGTDTLALLDRAVAEEKVAFVPGRAFAVEGGAGAADRCMRLAFSNVTPERIDEGIAALGRLLADAPDQARRHRMQETT